LPVAYFAPTSNASIFSGSTNGSGWVADCFRVEPISAVPLLKPRDHRPYEQPIVVRPELEAERRREIVPRLAVIPLQRVQHEPVERRRA
jgi:hypothetical protein